METTLAVTTIEDFQRLQERCRERRAQVTNRVLVCGGTGCRAAGSIAVYEALKQAAADLALADVAVTLTGCHGLCERGPVVVIGHDDVFYGRCRPEDAAEVLLSTIVEGRPVDKLLYRDTNRKETLAHVADIPFYAHQQRVALRYNGLIDPTDIEDFIAVGGYAALVRALTAMTPEHVLTEVEQSGLRGRGGGGFPTGRKWRSAAEQPEATRYVICNGDEGDPGAFMDEGIMEGNPHGVIEGMLLGAYAIGSRQGYLYVRHEYPLARRQLEIALDQARAYGLLGDKILGSGFDFDLQTVRGGGAFVCGESSALLSSLEGDAGEPRPKYIHMAQEGLWRKPTILNNVETWVNVPEIIRNGAAWFKAIGTEGSSGTKVFSVVGKVKHTGLVEVPMGMTLRELVYGVCGGVAGDRPLKGVQTGGPSGGVIPEQHLDLALDFDSLAEVGSMMGSGGMIVLDDRTCMVEIARYFTEFLADESCGKCVPCREGLSQMLRILTGMTEGRGTVEDLATLEDLAAVLAEASLCALGSTAANPLLSMLPYVRDEYEEHLVQKRCRAGVCTGLTTFAIDSQRCTGCHACPKVCPVACISGTAKETHEIDAARCIRCGLCREACRFEAIGVI
ncbi:MAG: NADH-ubiquinone oxidoreductase-F iron-sulfur binding region domain-containing protein [Armatimonadota bacterium]